MAAWNDRAAELFGAGRFADALEAARNALRIDRKNATSLNNEANALFRLGRADETVRAHERLLEIAPTFLPSWCNYAAILKHLGRKSEALRAFLEAAELAAGEANATLTQVRQEIATLQGEGVRPGPRRHQGFLAAAHQAMLRTRPAQALAFFDQALAASPRSAACWAWKARALRELKRFDDALACVEAGLRQIGEDAELHQERGIALRDLRRFDDAIHAFEDAIRADPLNPAPWSDRGKALGVMKRAEQALDSLVRATELAPRHPAPWQNRALVEEELGRFEEAARSFAEFLRHASPEMRPQIEHAKARLPVLEAQARARRGERLAAPAVPAVELPPERPMVERADPAASGSRVEEILRSLFGDEDPLRLFPKEVREQLDAAITRGDEAGLQRILAAAFSSPGLGGAGPQRMPGTPAHAQAPAAPLQPPAAAVVIPEAVVPKGPASVPFPDAIRQAEISLNQGQPERALEFYDQAIIGQPTNYSLWAGKAEALFQLKRHAECVGHVRKALALNPRFVNGWQRQAAALEGLGLYDEALAAWDTGLRLAPKSLPLLNGRGLTLFSLRRYDEACAAFEQVLALDPRHALARFNLAHVELKRGRSAEAARSFRQFLSVAPPHLVAQIEDARRRIAELGA